MLQNDIAPKSGLMLCDFASGFCFQRKVSVKICSRILVLFSYGDNLFKQMQAKGITSCSFISLFSYIDDIQSSVIYDP